MRDLESRGSGWSCDSTGGSAPGASLWLLVLLAAALFWRRRSTGARAVTLGAALLFAAPVLWLPSSARAQEGYNILTFRPTGLDSGGIAVEGSDPIEAFEYRVGLTYSYANLPVQLLDRASPDDELIPLVRSSQVLHLRATVGLADDLAATLVAPMLAAQDVDATLTPVGTSGLGDVALLAKYSLLDRYDDAVGLAALVIVRFPTGDSQALASANGLSGGVNLIVDRQFGPLAAIVNVGYGYTPEQRFKGSVQRDAVTFGLGTRTDIFDDHLQAIVEWAGHYSLANARTGQQVSAGLATRIGSVQASIGGGPGIGLETGTPDWRALVDIAYVGTASRVDRPDRIVEPSKLCDVPANYDGPLDADGCPILDTDGDGLVDRDDRCVDQPEDFDGFADDDGCPDTDDDADEIVDADDECPREAEDRDGFADEDGCPDPDNDGDSIVDYDDKCPDEAETINRFQDEDGCPDTFKKGAVLTVYSLRFREGSDLLIPGSEKVLDELIGVLKENPTMRIRIEGHADYIGHKADNLELSRKRTRTVVRYLWAAGIAKDRVPYVGYGESRPLIDEYTDEARAKNRRVEFRVLEE
nr:OmpA family protein [Persicimonas caeni]